MSKYGKGHWYGVEEMRSTLRLMNYCDDIANELASWVRLQLQGAFNRGFKNAMHERTENYVLFDMHAHPITHASVVEELKVQKAINAELLEALIDCREALRQSGATGELKVVDAAISKAKVGQA